MGKGYPAHLKAVGKLSEAELARDLVHVAKMFDAGPAGNTLHSRGRIAALLRRAASIVKSTDADPAPDTPLEENG